MFDDRFISPATAIRTLLAERARESPITMRAVVVLKQYYVFVVDVDVWVVFVLRKPYTQRDVVLMTEADDSEQQFNRSVHFDIELGCVHRNLL